MSIFFTAILFWTASVTLACDPRYPWSCGDFPPSYPWADNQPHPHYPQPKKEDCIRPIPQIYLPVCGSDGKTYENEWVLEVAACLFGFSALKADPITCPDFPLPGPPRVDQRPSEQCQLPFPRRIDPVCGSNGRSYLSKMDMEQASCIEGVLIVEEDPWTCPDFPASYLPRGEHVGPNNGPFADFFEYPLLSR